MLYLLRSYTKNKTILKLGYAKDYEFRLGQYKSHNPGIEEIATREGGLLDETRFHVYFHYLGFGDIGDEWYLDDPRIISDFIKLSLSDIDKFLWDNRDNIFSYSDLVVQNKKETLYSNLFSLNRNSILVENKLDRGIVLEFVGKDIDLSFISISEERRFNNILSNIKEASDNPVDKFLYKFHDITQFPDRMKFLYESNLDSSILEKVLESLPIMYKNFYYSISPEEAKRLSYRKGWLEKRYYRCLNNMKVDQEFLQDEIYFRFTVSKKYTREEIKKALGEIYITAGLKKTPKASDLEEYFELKSCLIQNKETGKRDNGFEIIKKKEGN